MKREPIEKFEVIYRRDYYIQHSADNNLQLENNDENIERGKW